MKHGFLAAAFLVMSAGLASADYVIIVANVGGEKELKSGGPPGMGMRGGPPGMGMRGGPPGMGAAGGPPGPGFPGGPPGMGAAGGPPGAGAAGAPPGLGAAGGPPGFGAAGGPPGMGAQGMFPGMGARGGARGMPGGGMMMDGMMGGPSDADDAPYYVIAVVEVKPHGRGTLVKEFDKSPVGVAHVDLPPRFGTSCYLMKNPPFGEMFIITEGKDKPLATVAQRYKEEFDKTMKGASNPTLKANGYLYLARWALEHGMLDKFPELMDKLATEDASNPAALAYQKIKGELDRKPSQDASVRSWSGKLLPTYKVTESPHYLIIHPAAINAAALTSHTNHLENSFRGFYYWFALQRITLTVPQTRQIVILTSQKSDFERLHKILTSSPVVVDGFHARRENLAVMTSQRQDDTYDALKTFWKSKGQGYDVSKLLDSKDAKPKSAMPQRDFLEAKAGVPVKLAERQMLVLMLKALEEEAELATVSHDATRQLLFASGLLPRNVAVPEWIQFGMGSFFETPLQSPWPTIGAPSPYYLPRWRELRDKSGLEKSRVATLKKVITDGYFRGLPPDGKPNSEAHRKHQSELRKARTVSWSLTYFLAQKHLSGLRRYFAELSKMPRDIELDDTVLLGCFARAFGCVDSNNKLNEAQLVRLAEDWYGYWGHVNFDSEGTMKEIREKIAKKMDEAKKASSTQTNNNGGQRGPFPGGPGGFAPGGPGGFVPGGPGGQQGFPPQGGPGGFPPSPPGGAQRPGGN